MKSDTAKAAGLTQPNPIHIGALVLLSLAVSLVAFAHPLLELVRRWSTQDEYSHAFFIPAISAWLLWSRRQAILDSIGSPSWTGPLLLLIAATMHIVGELSALFILSQVGFVLALLGIALGLGGRSLLQVVFIPIVFLLFAIPLPYFIDAVLTWRLQIVSSQLGTLFIRLVGLPVYLEGNVIDLGVYKLQVVEACSGLRYLYPLLSLGFLAAYLFQAPLWQRAVVFLSTIPITIIMNSLRIGIVGILVNSFGPQDADGFLHMFEGWIIFIACAGVLAIEMALFARFASGKKFFDVFYAPKILPSQADKSGPFSRSPAVTCLILLWGATVLGFLVSGRQEVRPERISFAGFPARVGDWQGRPSVMGADVEQGLGLTDYLLSDYVRSDGRAVNFYVAYYASQRSGVSPHSPTVCIPGNGWQITAFERTRYDNPGKRISLPLNRAIISKGSTKQLVYYWFDERGAQIANEYVSKLYLLRDALLSNRTDGSLIRLTTVIYPTENESDADARLQEFIQSAVPKLTDYLPAEPGLKIRPAMNQPGAKNPT